MATDPRKYVGRTFAGRYLIERPLAEGGMGAVFEATQTSLGRKVAIKVVKASWGGHDEVVKRFQREAEAVARLQHPNIVTVVDAGEAEDGTLFLAMELLTGETVRAALKREHHFTWQRALAIVEDVASALMAAHQAGVIHRDLKAENVMLAQPAGRPEQAKVLDFGVAKLTARTELPQVTGSGFVAGTPGCIAPEQMLGKSDDPRSDLYSVGVLLFEMLAGQGPFPGSSGMELMMRHLTEPTPRVAAVCARQGIEVPAPVDELSAALLSKDPDERPRDAKQLVEVVRVLRESSMATMPSQRTPGGGIALSLSPDQPTGDDEVLPAARLASVSGGAEAPTRATPLDLAAPTAPSMRRRRAWLMAASVAGLALIGGGLFYLSSLHANRLATTDEGAQAVDKAIEAAWQADFSLARREAERALHVDEGATGAALVRALAAIAEDQPFARYDARIAEAGAIASRAARTMVGVASHTEQMVERLATYDLATAQAELRVHSAVCEDPLEALISAARLTSLESRPGVIRELYALIGEPERAIVKLGFVRADLLEGTAESLARARQTLAQLERDVPLTGVIVQAQVQLSLAEGNPSGAIERLERWTQQNGDDLAARRRLVALLSRGSPAGLRDAASAARVAEQLEAIGRRTTELEAAGGERAVDELAALGNSYAVLGRIRAATALWQRALELAGADHRRKMEIASQASLFARLRKDPSQTRVWSDLIIAQARHLPEGSSSRERGELVWHAVQVMRIADQQDPDVNAVRGSAKLLAQTKQDVPLLVDTARWYFTVADGNLDEGRRLAAAMGSCMGPFHLARQALFEAELEPDAPTRDEKLRGAALAVESATSDALRLRCTLGNDAPSLAMAVSYGELLLKQAQLAVQLRQESAPTLLERAAAYWAAADEDSRPTLLLAELRRALAPAGGHPGEPP